MKILYLHGLASGANSMTVDILRKTFKGKHGVFAFDLYHDPEKSMSLIYSFLEHNKIDLIIGTSLGAFYALCTNTTIPKILFNPAFSPWKDLKQFLGYNQYFVKRQNEKEEGFVLTEGDLDAFKEHYSPRFATETDTIILSCNDEVLKNSLAEHCYEISYLLYERHARLKTTNLCGHSMSAKFIKTELVDEIEKYSTLLENKQ